jgi:hypothetical protein
MSKIKVFTKVFSLFLIVSILFTACEVPDISKFSEQSAGMTSGIRRSITETGDVLKTASESNELFEKETLDNFKTHSKNFNNAMKPTIETLDSLDAYLDALNALAQSNKQSAENSKAVIGSFSNLVTSASQLVLIGKPTAAVEIPEQALNIATGFLAVFDQFRTAKSFKERVNYASIIVEGKYSETKEEKIINGKKKTLTTYKKICTDANRIEIENIGKQLTQAYKNIDEHTPAYSNAEKKTRKEAEIKIYDAQAEIFGCGIIDLLKFTMQDLKTINNNVSGLIQRSFRLNNLDTAILYKNIEKNNLRIQKELALILEHKSLISQIKEYEFYYSVENDASKKEDFRKEARRRVKKDKEILDGIILLDGRIKNDLITEIVKCDDGAGNTSCLGMKNFIQLTSYDRNNDATLNPLYASLPLQNLYVGNSYIETVLDNRKNQLFAENSSFLAEKARIKPDYEKTINKLNEMIKKQNQLDSAFSSSISALNAWLTTHANLRVAVNTKKPLSVANLTAKVKEIWSIIQPDAK